MSSRCFPGAIPPDIGKLVKLTSLYLTYTKIEGPMPDLSTLQKLTYLGISNTKIDGVPFCNIIIPQLPTGITGLDSGTCSEGRYYDRIYHMSRRVIGEIQLLLA